MAARECITENRVLRRIAPASVEATGGYFVATPDDPDDYVEAFAANCAASGVDCEEVEVGPLLAKEPALNRRIRRAFRVPDGSIEPWQLIESTLADARVHGSEAHSYQRVIGFDVTGGRIVAATLRNERDGSDRRRSGSSSSFSASGAWAGQIAGLAGVQVEMTPGKGTMLIYNHRMTDAVINRCHKSSDGDIMVPVHTVAILGTTDIKVPDPDDYDITREEVAGLVAEGSKLFPDLPRMRILRAYAGVRPLYRPPADAGRGGGNRAISRAHAILDHADQGVDNFVSIVGGKLTTHRLMAEETVDAVTAKMGVDARCTTADEVLPGQPGGHTYWLGHRLADHEETGGGDARPPVRVRARHPADGRRVPRHATGRARSTTSGAARGSAWGPARARSARSGSPASSRSGSTPGRRPARRPHRPPPRTRIGYAEGSAAAHAAIADHALTAFLRERFKGTRPIAQGRQLQELLMTNGIYVGVLGLDSIDGTPTAGRSPRRRADRCRALTSSSSGPGSPA